MKDLMSDDAIEAALFAAIDEGKVEIPPYPAVALKLNKILARPDFDLSELLAVLQSDQSLVASVLRSANSAYFNRGEVTSLSQAVLRIGADEVSRLALTASLAGQLKTPGSLQELKQRVWENSVASASICQALAKHRKLHHEDAFVAGLLHDFGWLVGITALEKVIARQQGAAREIENWSGMIERLHVKLGLQVAEKWRLPALLHGVMADHHFAGAPKGDHAKLTALVSASDAIVALMAVQPHVSAADLEKLPQLLAGEPEALASMLPEIPSLISSFNPEAAQKHAPSALIQPATLPPEGFRPIDLRVAQLKPKPQGPFTMSGIASHGWTMRGSDALPVLQLMEAEILIPSQPALRLWAKTTICTSQGGGYQVECKPFALNGPTLTRWNDLFRTTARQAAALFLPGNSRL
jgi:HD-like signal output (HDOD) protein